MFLPTNSLRNFFSFTELNHGENTEEVVAGQHIV